MANSDFAMESLRRHRDSQVVVFGELSLSGYSCGDLFAQDCLLEAVLKGLARMADATRASGQLVVVGLPLQVDGKLFNVAAAIFDGQVRAIVPKQYVPNYQEFYEARWFHPATGDEPASVSLEGLGNIPFGIDLLVQWGGLIVGIEICEDLWMPLPPSSWQSAGGANLLLNLSASNELIGKPEWRELLVRSQSGRCLAAYAYASAGPSESTTDVVFGGHCMVAENGSLIAESKRIGHAGCTWLEHADATADIDLQKLRHDRRITNSWQLACDRATKPFRRVVLEAARTCDGSRRRVSAHPFVPEPGPALERRCSEIFGIQCAALSKRVQRLPAELPLYIGISGGLDSTLALLVAVKTCVQNDWPTSRIHGITMPGFGTTEKTLNSARELMQLLQVSASEIDIRGLCFQTFLAMGHRPFGIDIQPGAMTDFLEAVQALPKQQRKDLIFENVQARMRTMLLMNSGFVLGTGDLSEQALGWSTYNGDHMSMYNVNTSIPKTLVKFLVEYVALNEYEGDARACLLGILETPISPELLPTGAAGQIEQHTEQVLGPYELHDFFLYHLIRHGTQPSRILRLASLAKFSQDYSHDFMRATLRTFLKRFFANQFKRSCVPDGPKVGSVSLSPRGDWRMPSDAEVSAWLEDLE